MDLQASAIVTWQRIMTNVVVLLLLVLKFASDFSSHDLFGFKFHLSEWRTWSDKRKHFNVFQSFSSGSFSPASSHCSLFVCLLLTSFITSMCLISQTIIKRVAETEKRRKRRTQSERNGGGKKWKLTRQMKTKRVREGGRPEWKVKSEGDGEQVWEGN